MKINKSELLKVLTLVKPGLAKNDLIEGANDFIFMKNSILTYNDQIQIKTKFNIGLTGSVSSEELYSILSKLPDEEIEIEDNSEQIIMKGKRRKVTLPISELSNVLLSSFVNEEELKKWKPLPSDFSKSLKFCLFSVSNDCSDPSKALLTCLSIKKNMVVSSDNIRITQKTMESSISSELLIPGDSAKELIKYNPIKYCNTESWIHFCNEDNVIFSTRTLNGVFKDVTKFFNVEGTKVTLPNKLDDIIKRAETLTDKEDRMVTMIFSKGLLLCKGEGSNGKSYEEESRIVYNGPKIEIRVNPQFILQVLPILKDIVLSKNRLLFEGEGFAHVMCVNL